VEGSQLKFEQLQVATNMGELQALHERGVENRDIDHGECHHQFLL
jgi:hypothetical protein